MGSSWDLLLPGTFNPSFLMGLAPSRPTSFCFTATSPRRPGFRTAPKISLLSFSRRAHAHIFSQSFFILSNCIFIFVISCLRILSILSVGEGVLCPPWGHLARSAHALSPLGEGAAHQHLVCRSHGPPKPQPDMEQPPTAKDCPQGSD